MTDQQTSSTEVPQHPAHVLRVRAEPDGTESAWLDDQPVTLTPGTSPHQALIRAARRAADRTTPGRVIRVIGSTPDGQTFHMAIGPDGRAWAVPPPPVPARVTPKYVENHSASAVSALAPISALTPAAPETEPEEPVAAAEPVDAAEPDEEPVEEATEEPADAVVADNAPTPERVQRTAPATVDPDVPVPVDIPEIDVPEPDATLAAAVAALAERPVGRPANGFAKAPPPMPTPARPVPREARPAPRPANTDTGPAKTTADKAVSKTEPREAADDEMDGPRRRDVLLGAAAGATATALVGIGAAAAYIAVRHRDRPLVATPTIQPGSNALPDGINPPTGLPDTFAWSVSGIFGQGSKIATTQDQVFCTTNSNATGGAQLEALDATSGNRQWVYPLPAAAVAWSGPTIIPIDGVPSVVVATPGRIYVWATAGGHPRVWKVALKDTVTLTTSGVIVQKSGDTSHAFVLYDGALAQRALPSGSTPVAVLGDGSLVAVSNDGRAWHITDANTAPAATQLKGPAGTTPGTFLAATATLLVTAFVPSGNQEQAMVRSFTLPDFTPKTTTQPLQTPTPATFLLSPDQTWAVASNSWINMSNGRSHVITALWTPLAISPSLTWAKIGNTVLTADKLGRSLGASHNPDGQAVLPRGGTSQLTFAVASQGQNSTLYALPMPAGNTEG